MKPILEEEATGFKALKRLGGPIIAEDMDEYPTLPQWGRYFLYGESNAYAAIINALKFYANRVKRPLLEVDIENVRLKI